jgi:hypothetical protein
MTVNDRNSIPNSLSQKTGATAQGSAQDVSTRLYRAPQLVPAGAAVNLLQGWYGFHADGVRAGYYRVS